MYTYYPKKTCDGKGSFKGQTYNTLSEAKTACGKNEGCEMISTICEDCGSPKEKPTYYRTCSGGFLEPVNEYGKMLAEFAETWIKGWMSLYTI